MNLFTRFPIRLSIPLFLLLTALLAEGFTLQYNQNLADAREEKEALALVTQDMTQLQDNISDRLRKGDWEGVQSAIANRGSNPNITLVVLVDDIGTIIGSTSLKLIGVPVSRALPDVDAALLKEARATMAGRVFLSDDRRLVTAYYPVILGARVGEIRPHRVGILHLRYDLTANKAIRRHGLERQALVMAGFYVGYGLLLGIFLHLILVGRVGRLVLTARRLAAGDLSAQTGLLGKDELAQIGGAFDRMAGEIAKTNESLRKSEQRLQIHARKTPLAVIEWDTYFRVISWNPAAEKVFGFSAAEASGQHAEFIVPVSARPHIDRVWSDLLSRKGGERSTNENVTKDGRTILCEWYNTPLVTPDGGVIGVASLVQDITERKQAEEALSNLAAIVEYSEDAIIGKTPEGIITSWNRGAERLYGYRAEEVKGRSISLLIPEDHAGELSYIIDHTRHGIPIEHLETVRLRKDGSRVDVSVAISPILDAGGNIVGASTIARDITERKKSESELRTLNEKLEQRVTERTADLNRRSEELSENQLALMNIVEDLNLKTAELEQANARLEELDRLKSMFIASMSHELRTPLNSIIGFSSILHDEWIGPVNPEQKENLAIILRCGKHLLSLINDVIDVSKVEARKVEVLPQEFDLYELMQEGITFVAKEIKGKGLELRIENIRLQMFTDRQRLLQCVLNLLSNAMKFTEQGSIFVETQLVQAPGKALEGPVVEISVTDTGIGIREEDLPKIFHPFVRLASPLQATVPGTGLGLYLTRKLAADVLKGDILVRSEYGKGSRFTIRIPARIS